MNDEERRPQTFSIARRFGASVNLVITVGAVLAIVGMVNYLGMRRYVRVNWTRNAETELSQRTRHVLASLTNNVRIVTYYDSDDPLFPRVRAMLKEYENAAQGKIHVQHVDYLRDPTAAPRIKMEFKLDQMANRDLIIFECNGRHKIVNANDLSDYAASDPVPGKTNEFHRTHFKGELAFTSAIYGVALHPSPKAYFLIGHGEHSPGDESQQEGYSKFGLILQNENNFELASLLLTATNEIPSDCSLLIIAGPLTTIAPEQVERIQHYLDQGGRLLTLFNYQQIVKHRVSGLEKMLAAWGVDVGQNVVLDPENSANPTGIDPKPIVPGDHWIVNSLGSRQVHLFWPRSIRATRGNARGREEAKVEELLFTGRKTILVSAFDEGGRVLNPSASPPLPLAVVVEKSVPALERNSTRIVAIGDSMFWANAGIDFDANREFAASTVNWLVQQNLLLGEIPRQAIRTYKVSMTNGEMRNSRWLLLASMPGAVLLIGFIMWTRRRK
jgi:hypothetical protein